MKEKTSEEEEEEEGDVAVGEEDEGESIDHDVEREDNPEEDEKEEGEEEESGEGRIARGIRKVGQPTRTEREEHETAGHIPYRPWCKYCVMGRGRSRYHRHVEREADTT